MNQAFFKHAMERINSITDDEMQDALATHGMPFATKAKPGQPPVTEHTRFLTFTKSGTPGLLRRKVNQLAIEQLGEAWFEIGMEWKAVGNKQGESIMVMQVEDEAAEVLIRLVLPGDITISSKHHEHQ
jgi:hypothetical protein